MKTKQSKQSKRNYKFLFGDKDIGNTHNQKNKEMINTQGKIVMTWGVGERRTEQRGVSENL